jgi:hypothetical protein
MDDSVTLPSVATGMLISDKILSNVDINGNQDFDNLSVDSNGSDLHRININNPDASSKYQSYHQAKSETTGKSQQGSSTSVSSQPPSRSSIHSKLSKPPQSTTKDDASLGDDNVSVASSVTSVTRRRNDKRAQNMAGTLLMFHWANGARQEKELPYRPVTYSEVQREIAKFFPKCMSLFVLQNPQTGEKIFPQNFQPTDFLVIRELLCRSVETRPLQVPNPRFPTRWDTEEYHDPKHRRAMEQEAADNDIWNKTSVNHATNLQGNLPPASNISQPGNQWNLTAPF